MSGSCYNPNTIYNNRPYLNSPTPFNTSKITVGLQGFCDGIRSSLAQASKAKYSEGSGGFVEKRQEKGNWKYCLGCRAMNVIIMLTSPTGPQSMMPAISVLKLRIDEGQVFQGELGSILRQPEGHVPSQVR